MLVGMRVMYVLCVVKSIPPQLVANVMRTILQNALTHTHLGTKLSIKQ